ncbi:hypothetical protein PP707_04335, partial [Acetobacter pasteurianus]|nr:hypothetical protein [Acetobacter pasteurianus]
MSAGKYALGAAAIVGGVWYYDQNVQRILPRKEHQQLAQQTARIDHKAHELNNKLTNKIEDGKSHLQKKTETVKDDVKSSQTYKDFQANKTDYKKHVEDATTPRSEKSVFALGMERYIDFVNCLGEGKVKTGETQYSSVGPLPEVKEKPIFGNWFSKGEDKVDQAKEEAEKKKNEWTAWGSSKADQAKADAEKEKNKLFNWGSDKKDEAKDKAEQAKKDAESKKNEWSNWASQKVDDVKSDAEKQKNKVESWVSDKTSDAEAKKDEWVNRGSKKADQAQADAEK